MFVAVDIGGTKTLVAAFTEAGEITEERRFATPQDYAAFITELANEVAKLTTREFKHGVVAVPGRLDRQTGVGIAFGRLPWENVPIGVDVAKIFGCPVQIENDANLAALSEANLLKHKYHKVFYITVSTGIGGGYVINGILDPDTIDAEIGAQIMEHEGKLMKWESFASGKAIVSKYGKRASDITDPHAWKAIAKNLSLGIYNVIRTYTPEVIVIGGGVGGHLDKFRDFLEKQLQDYNPDLQIPPINEAQRPTQAVIYGCFELAKQSQR